MKGIQLGALWFSQNGLQCWDHVCHKRHPSSIFGALVFHAKTVSMLRRCLHSWGQNRASRFSQKWATLRQSHARSIIKIVDLHFTFQSTRLFSNETTEIPALAPCKMKVTLMIYVDCKSNICPNGDHVPKPEQDREIMFECWSMLLGATPQTNRDSAAYALLPGPSHFVSCQRNSGLLIRHGPAPHHRLKSVAGLVDEVDFKMFKAQNLWMSWLFTNPDMHDRLGYSC